MNKDFARGMIVSLALKSLPVRKKSPIAYLYNGVRLPALPVVDGASKAVLVESNGVYVVDIFNGNLEAYNTGNVSLLGANMFKYADGQWVKTYWTTYPTGKPVWTNHDIYYKTNESYGDLSGALCMAGSDPIPIYNEPVNYLYNGVKLPKLPEWDKTVYPYAFVFYSNLDADYFLITFNKQPIAYYPDYSEFLYIGSPDKISYQWWGKSSQWNERVEPFWVRENADGYGMSAEKELWTDNDIFYEDGTIYLAASEPIPIYE